MISTARYDKESGKLTVLTIVNTDYEKIEDRIFLEWGIYRILNDNGLCALEEYGDKTILKLKLKANESIALLGLELFTS